MGTLLQWGHMGEKWEQYRPQEFYEAWLSITWKFFISFYCLLTKWNKKELASEKPIPVFKQRSTVRNKILNYFFFLLTYHDWFHLYKMEFKTHFRHYKRYEDLKEFVIKSSNSIKQLQRHFFHEIMQFFHEVTHFWKIWKYIHAGVF